MAEDLRADAVVALVGLEAQPLVGLDGVEALVLQRVGAQLVGEADAAPFLVQVQQHAAAGARRSAAAPPRAASPQSQRAEWKTSPVRHFECTRTSTSSPSPIVAADQREVRFLVDQALVAVDAERAVLGRQIGFGDFRAPALRSASDSGSDPRS